MRKALMMLLMTGTALAQATTYTGVIKDLSLNIVTSGQVTFTLAPPTDSTIPGVGRFTPSVVTCNINADGTLSGYVGGVVSGACFVASNTALSPTGTSYRICIQPQFVTPGSCFYDYATTASKDISTVAPTLSTGPINYGAPAGPQGSPGPTGPPGGSLSYPGVTSDGAGGLSTAQTVVNVKAFGCTGNGTTDDSACIASAIAAHDVLGAGVLYFPVGNYLSNTCAFVITTPVIIRGDGVTDQTLGTFGSQVVCKSTTAVLFTITSNSGLIEDISFTNTAATTPTAGAAVFTNSPIVFQRVNFQNVQINGFFDGIHIGVGSRWKMYDCEIDNTVRRGVWIQNTINSEAGDWVMFGNEFAAGPRTSTTGSAAVYQDSSGGGKMTMNKVNSMGGGNYEHGLVLNLFGSNQGEYNFNNMETTLKEPIYIQHAWPRLHFEGNILIAPGGFAGIFSADAMNIAYLGGGSIDVLSSPASYAINLSISGQNITVMPFATNQAAWTLGLTNIVTDTAVSNFNNTNLNTKDFKGQTVTAVTGNFSSGFSVGTPGAGGLLGWSGKSGGANWNCQTSGGIGLQCLSSGGAEFDLFDNSMVNSGHGPYAIGGIPGFTGVKTGAACVFTIQGGLVMNVTGC